MHSHHEGPLFEPTHDPQKRYDYIVAHKPEDEIELRLALFAAIPDEVVMQYFPGGKEGAAYYNAAEVYDKARKAYYRAGEVYGKTGMAYYKKKREVYGKAVEVYYNAAEVYEKAVEVYDKAREDYYKAAAYYKTQGASAALERMHKDLCWPWCPGKNIFAKGKDLKKLIEEASDE